MSAASAQESLVLNRLFSAPIQTVFDAWTKAEVLAQWFGPEGFDVLDASCEISVGGKYEIVIQSPDNNTIKHYGEYVEISPPHRLAFTWVLENQSCQGSEGQQAATLVTLQLHEVPDDTSLTLTHEKLPDQTAYDGHQFGWLSSFDSLTHYLKDN